MSQAATGGLTMPDRYLSAAQFSRQFCISLRTIRRWRRQGILRGVMFDKQWRISEREIQSHLHDVSDPLTNCVSSAKRPEPAP